MAYFEKFNQLNSERLKPENNCVDKQLAIAKRIFDLCKECLPDYDINSLKEKISGDLKDFFSIANELMGKQKSEEMKCKRNYLNKEAYDTQTSRNKFNKDNPYKGK